MEQGTDPRILNLMFAVMGFINSQNQPKNPFVRGLGAVKNNQEAYEYLFMAIDACSDYYPEVEEMVNNLVLSETE